MSDAHRSMDLVGPQPRVRLHQPQWPLHIGHVPRTIVWTPSDGGAQGNWIRNSLVAADCLIEGRLVACSILSPGVCVEADAEVEESILFDGVWIGRGATVSEGGITIVADTTVA